jgi:hypothetical protein
MSQVLGAFGLLDFTMLGLVLAQPCFETYKPFISLIFLFLVPRMAETADTESVDTGARLYIHTYDSHPIASRRGIFLLKETKENHYNTAKVVGVVAEI